MFRITANFSLFASTTNVSGKRHEKCFNLQSVATIGSTLTSVQHDVKTMQTALEDHKKETDDLKKTMVKNIKILASFTHHSFQLEPMPAFSSSEPVSGTSVQMHELQNELDDRLYNI